MNDIDRTPEKYNIMIAKGIIHPQQLMFSCMECNDNCISCGTGADWIMNSSASKHFTSDMSDFSSYEELPESEDSYVMTAAKTVCIVRKGAVIIGHLVEEHNLKYDHIT